MEKAGAVDGSRNTWTQDNKVHVHVKPKVNIDMFLTYVTLF